MTALDHLVRLTGALQSIAHSQDCDYIDFPKDRPDPCPCPKHVALRALADGDDWRYRSAHHERATNGFNPRETAIVAAWRRQVDDRMLAAVLSNEEQPAQVPTARDWFVATSVVQWLATNVGMEVLRLAGWEYTRWEQDRAAREERERRGARRVLGTITAFDTRTWCGIVTADDPTEGEIAFHGTSSQRSGADSVGAKVAVVFNDDGRVLSVRDFVLPPVPYGCYPGLKGQRCHKCGGDREACGGCPAHL